MFRTRWRLFRLWGLSINIDASWLIIVALLTWTLTTVFRGAAPGAPTAEYWAMGLITALAFFVCILLHELGHALVARRLGIPLRGVTLFLFGGVAELEGEPASAGAEFVMAIAGPIVSAVLVGVFAALAVAGSTAAWPWQVVLVLEYLAGINLWVLIFNLVPAFPLDGGRVLRSILWGAMGNVRRATYVASLCGRAFSWVLIGLGVLEFFYGEVMGGVWMCLIGLFLGQAAASGYQQVLIREALQGEPVRRIMDPAPVTAPPSLDLQHWVEDYVYRGRQKAFPVAEDGRLEGVIDTSALSRYPRGEWPLHTVGEAMRHDVAPLSVPPDADAFQALERMRRTGSNRLLVTDGGRLVGVVSRRDLMNFLALKLELEDGDDGGPPPEEAPAQPGERGASSPLMMRTIRGLTPPARQEPLVQGLQLSLRPALRGRGRRPTPRRKGES
jgi:Zn-dependent protease/CBS domain-containing protein